MIKKVLLLAGILAVFSTTKAHPATDNDTIEVVYADTTGIDIDSIEASIDHIELDEVTVEASAWVRKADRNLLFPNAQQIKQSKNGLQLLQKLQIPGIVINPTDNSISLTDKSELSLRINGRPVTEKEIQGISPEQIIRVEYIDNPGIRYGEAGAVLDFIIKTPTSGGSFMGNFTPSLTEGGDNIGLRSKSTPANQNSPIPGGSHHAGIWKWVVAIQKDTNLPMVPGMSAPSKAKKEAGSRLGTTDTH